MRPSVHRVFLAKKQAGCQRSDLAPSVRDFANLNKSPVTQFRQEPQIYRNNTRNSRKICQNSTPRIVSWNCPEISSAIGKSRRVYLLLMFWVAGVGRRQPETPGLPSLSPVPTTQRPSPNVTFGVTSRTLRQRTQTQFTISENPLRQQSRIGR